MLFFLLIGACLAVINAQVRPSAYQMLIGSKHMKGGSKTTIQEHPYQVAILRGSNYECGGVIISRNYVLTTGTCLTGSITGRQIRSGSSVWNKGGKVHDIVRKVLHEDFTWGSNLPLSPDANIGIAIVEQPFDYDETCRPIALHSEISSESFVVNKNVIFSGWGDSKNSKSVQLQKLELPLVSKRSCVRSYSIFGKIFEGQICAGYLTGNTKDICVNDPGSPLVLNNKLIGIADSSGGTCGQAGFPLYFTEVAYYYDWIKNNVKFDQ